jgi:hypothetical protein
MTRSAKAATAPTPGLASGGADYVEAFPIELNLPDLLMVVVRNLFQVITLQLCLGRDRKVNFPLCSAKAG